MNLEEMKNQWVGLNSRLDTTETNINNNINNKMKTAQQQLVNQYRRLCGIAAVFAPLSYMTFSRLDINAWAAGVFPIFFFVCAMMDFILQRKVGEINLAAMSVTEVAQKSASCRRLHHIFQLILIPIGVALLASLAYMMTDDKAFIYGMCIGVAVGMAIGLKSYFKFMDNYKSLIKG